MRKLFRSGSKVGKIALINLPNVLLNSKASEQQFRVYVPLKKIYNIFTAVKAVPITAAHIYLAVVRLDGRECSFIMHLAF